VSRSGEDTESSEKKKKGMMEIVHCISHKFPSKLNVQELFYCPSKDRMDRLVSSGFAERQFVRALALEGNH